MCRRWESWGMVLLWSDITCTLHGLCEERGDRQQRKQKVQDEATCSLVGTMAAWVFHCQEASHCFRNGRHLWDPSSCLQFIGKWGLGRFGDLPTLTYLVGSRARMESGYFGSKTSFNYTTKHLYSGNSQNLKISHLDENLSQLVYAIPVFLIQSIINITEPFLCEARPPLWMKINVIDSVIQSLWIRIWQCSVMLGYDNYLWISMDWLFTLIPCHPRCLCPKYHSLHLPSNSNSKLMFLKFIL